MEFIKKILISFIIYGFFLIFLALFLDKAIAWDKYLFLQIYNLSNPYLLVIFNLITYIGSSVFWVLLIILSWLKKKRKLSLHLLFAFILDTISLLVLKNVFLRSRPFENFQAGNSIDFDIGPSFPSGHSERAFSGAVVLSNHYKKYRLLFFTLSALASFSRVFIGVHYPLDVIVGSINGIILGMIALAIPVKKLGKIKI